MSKICKPPRKPNPPPENRFLRQLHSQVEDSSDSPQTRLARTAGTAGFSSVDLHELFLRQNTDSDKILIFAWDPPACPQAALRRSPNESGSASSFHRPGSATTHTPWNFSICIIVHYGWEGTALAGVLLVMFGIQLYYYLFVYGRIPKYKDTRRPEILSETPPVSVVIPLFSEDYAFVEEILPLIVAQEYPDFEVVIVYVGRDTDFYDDLVRIKQSFPQITATKIELNPRFPISPKMALNVGIKSAHYEHLLFTTPDVYPTSDRWLSLMANGFRRGEIVLGYCGMERGKGFASYLIRTWRMMHSVDWISSAVCGRPYRGMRQNYGFTKRLYFGANGFSHLNMNIGEDDLFMSRIIAPGNVSVVLSPRATLREKSWGGLKWWIGTQRFFGGAIPFYPLWVKNFIQWELGSRILFWLAAIVALAVMPWEFKIAAGVLLLARFAIVLVEARRISRRLGEEKICGRYFLYDLLSPFFALLLGLLLLRKDERVWR